MTIETTYRGYNIRWSENEDAWTCYDFARPKTNKSLAALKVAIDAAERQERKAASVEAFRIKSERVDPVTVVEFLGRARYGEGEEVAVMGDAGHWSTREKSRTHANLRDLAPVTDEAAEAIERYRAALATLAEAKKAADVAQAAIPRISKEHLAGLVALYEREQAKESASE